MTLGLYVTVDDQGNYVSFYELKVTEHAQKIWVNCASLMNKATVRTNPKMLQLELSREIFSAKYGLNEPISRI